MDRTRNTEVLVCHVLEEMSKSKILDMTFSIKFDYSRKEKTELKNNLKKDYNPGDSFKNFRHKNGNVHRTIIGKLLTENPISLLWLNIIHD